MMPADWNMLLGRLRGLGLRVTYSNARTGKIHLEAPEDMR